MEIFILRIIVFLMGFFLIIFLYKGKYDNK